MTQESLSHSWDDLLKKLNVRDWELGRKIFLELVLAYSQANRYYNTLNHIHSVLSVIQPVIDSIERPEHLLLGIWFHDTIYEPKRNDNEEQSAIYAELSLDRLAINSSTIAAVKQLILNTKHHYPLVNHLNSWLFLDSDLSILGASNDDYQQYAKNIRLEYIFLSDREYRRGRIQILQQFLARKRIYYSDYFFCKLESQARINLQTEIDRLLIDR
jgi:predicted metal-dependent HD superfamily phosphohydrolase